MAANLVIPTAIRALRAVVKKGIAVVRDRLPQAGHDLASIEPALARNTQRLQQPAARIRQQQQQARSSNGYQTFSRNFTTYRHPNGGPAPKTPVRTAVSKINKSTPFASTLRPKLCGALPRSMNGYSLGGNARYFSHSTAPAQVVQQVSAAMRAFILSGSDVSYNSSKRRNNTSTYARGQIKMHLAALNTDRLAPGAYIDFHIVPKFTCMSESDPIGYTCLDNSRGGFMDELDVEFNNAISDISRVYRDLRKLSALGELPVTLVPPATLRVHFRGCDAQLVTALCDEVGVETGVIHEDERFAYDRLIPTDHHVDSVNWREMLSSSDDEDETDWERYSAIPSHEINNPIYDAMSLSDQQGNHGPHWEDDGEEFYDEIDPGGVSSDDGLFSKEEYMIESGGFVNPWVMPTANQVGAF
ncbi:hypothetical protein TWF106_003708 [Orbilia oligospora]|uniref:Uncharacterized protein n=1 Tax=Orbilia oligospora TaxID=2813651 RepID=A0A6G1MKP3_ORBOL|nr:hypothetical protein TWF788_002718 [Orbilia oligospora]KAF3197618.1 hypothetical protein TWF679_002904 [Orbilia oligospora]KAF3199737.1 hypothetical protein TWF106_003708 [Orbilia oligospora]KAF3228645.1 hypothetical protein TWF191_002500 [Orbilia oligospora]KAF3261733.1 hypothetical protein TWF192_008191 [Orbilia oligospora]